VKTYQLKIQQAIPISLEQAWDFFSSPLNLAKITPPEMNFVVTSDYTVETKMYEGMLISYTITPLFGIRMRWTTEITHVKDGEYFVDEQRFGPYALWHHEHHFKQIKGGVLMDDILTYAMPYGPIGQLANSILVDKRVRSIFDYRVKAVEDLFGKFVD
jgi:ligand-binding SRPBCC domain-containing protein